MGASLTRLEGMWLPAQSGKTRKCEERIKEQELREQELQEVIDLDNTRSNILNIVICSNNRALVDQTTIRMSDDLYSSEDKEDNEDDEENIPCDANVINKVYAWRSGLKHRKEYGELCMDILEGTVEMVICCAHPTRLRYVHQMVERLNRSSLFKKKINIWIDEADASIKLWSKPELNVFNFEKVDKVTLISATFDSIFKKYGRMKIIPFADTHSDVYHKISDSNIINETALGVKGALGFLVEVFKTREEELCKEGIRLFAPGDVSRKSHDEIAHFLLSKGFVVVILNGERKKILGIPGEGEISLDSDVDFAKTGPVEIGKQLADIYIKKGLYRYPYAITGNICLGRGITFQNENFMFNWGVIPFISDKANAYQVVCRTNGNVRHLPNYAPPTLIMTDKMTRQVIDHENLAVNVARIVHERYQECPEFDGSIGNEDLKDINDPYERQRMHVPVEIPLSEEEFLAIEATEKNKQEQVIRSLIEKKDNSLYLKITGYKCIQKTTPNADNSYKKHILDVSKKVQAQQKFYMDINKKDRNINSCQFYIDNKHYRIFVIIYSGALNRE